MPRVDGIAFVTGNLAGALAFYRLLGIDVPDPAPGAGYVSIACEGVRFSWSTCEADACAGSDQTRSQASADCVLMLRLARTAEVDAVAEAVRRAGHHVVRGPFDAPWGARHCRLRDPDGNAVEIFAPLP